ncbi:hypothetical protein HanPSC8_Chr06g0256741 [Helianthus annuus]|nr:hypothetical protein HanIR_Chr06g0286291 [Helianthus annuus]KAJ0916020.1 hypothetical protein HanPSC8_Chr06g0256741 [Helianthus annuus]
MAASVEYRQEEMISGEIKEKENVDDLSLFVDFSGVNLNLDVLQNSNQIRVALESAPVSPLKPETKSTIHGQDSGAGDLLNSLNNITDYDWLLSPPRHPLPSPEIEERITLNDHTPISNGQSTSPESKLENPPADGTSTTDASPKPLVSSSNGVKPSRTIRRPSPSRKTPSTGSRPAPPTTRPTLTKPSRSSTPTSRATVAAATKPVAPIKRSTTPMPRLPVLAPTCKSTSRSSTPIQRSSVTAKSASRSSTPTPRPSVTAPVKSASLCSTPTQRPSVTASAKSAASRSSTPTQRPSVTASAKSAASRSSTPTQRPSVTASAKSAASISSTPTQRPSVTASAKSAASRSSTPTQRPSVTATAKSASRSSTPTLRSSNGSVKSVMTRSRGHSNGDDDVNPVLMGTQMVERVVNMRKLAPPKQDRMSDPDNASGKLSVSQDNSGFGRSLSKKSFDMALRHLDIRRSMPGNMRASITKVPASSVYSVRPESGKTRTMSASDSPLATSSSASSDHSEPGHSYH